METIMVELQDFIDKQRILLAKERNAEIDRSSLLLSNCGPKILEQKGLSLGGLGVVGMHVGLGGKTYASFPTKSIYADANRLSKDSLVELERPSAYHSSLVFPPHTFRYFMALSGVLKINHTMIGQAILLE